MPVTFAGVPVEPVRCYAGGMPDSGHSAVVDSLGQLLWLAGCDRWQQLGLDSPGAGAGGYIWKSGKIPRPTFVGNDFVPSFLRNLDPKT